MSKRQRKVENMAAGAMENATSKAPAVARKAYRKIVKKIRREDGGLYSPDLYATLGLTVGMALQGIPDELLYREAAVLLQVVKNQLMVEITLREPKGTVQ